ncbi:MAG: ATP synthase F1 subunit gamma [Planctomycetota bacterium]
MGKSREIKGRIKAVGNIRRITRTMQMIATSKFARAQQAAVSSKPYTEGLFDLVGKLGSAAEGLDHPLLASGDGADSGGGKPELTLVLTSNRGLCGPYNGNVLKTSIHHLRGNEAARDGRVELVGKKGLTVLKFAQVPVARFHEQFGDTPNYDAVEQLAGEYIDAFTSGEVSAVRVVYMRYISAGRQVPEVLQLLPFSADNLGAGDEAAADDSSSRVEATPEFSPEPEALLDELLPAAVKAVLFQAFNDAIVSEHVARMVAMKAATDNAAKMGKALKRKFNRARQAQITTELNEIVSGAAALG